MDAINTWAQEAAAAFISSEKAISILQKTGDALRSLFSTAEEAVAHPHLRVAFKDAYLSMGGNPANVPGNWAAVLYQYAYPGEGKSRGNYYKRLEDGTTALDKERNACPTPPPGIVKKAPAYLKNLRTVGVEDAATLMSFPIRCIVAAGSGGGKTTFVKQLINYLQSESIVNYTFIMTGTRVDHWDGLQEGTEIVEFDGNYERIEELINIQKEIVRENPRDEAMWGRPLFVFDDLGDQASAKKGKGGQLLDEFYMTLRNFNISVIAMNQQQNNFFTPARRDGATSILVGDLTNKQREGIYDTLGIPPSKLKKQDFIEYCDTWLGRRNGYNFLLYAKEQTQTLWLTHADADGGGVESITHGLTGMSVAARVPKPHFTDDDDETNDPESASALYSSESGSTGRAGGGYAGGAGGGFDAPAFKGDRRRLQGGSNQKPAQDLYTTNIKTILPLIDVLNARHTGSKIWEPCVGLGNIAKPLFDAGFEVIGTDLYSMNPDGSFTANPSQSFVECEVDGVSYSECALPEGFDPAKDIIVTNPPFSLKLKFIQRFYELGIPTYCILPIETYGAKGCVRLFIEHGVEMFYLTGGKAASTFHKVSEERDVAVGTCAWFAFNTRADAKEKNVSFFLEDAK